MRFSKYTIKKRLKYIYKKYKLRELCILSTTGSFYVAKCEDKNGNCFIIKMRLKKNEKHRDIFLKEIKFWKRLGKINGKIFKVPKIIISETNKKPEILIYSFIKGYGIGHFCYLNKDRIKNITPGNIVKCIKIIQDKFTKFYNIKRKDFYPDILHFYNYYLKKTSAFIKKDFLTAKKIIKNNKSFLSESKFLKFSHNDLNPRNIIVDDNNNITFIDWSDIGINLMTYDFVFLYLASWNCREFKKNLLKNFKEEFNYYQNIEKLIHLTVLILTPKFLKIVSDDRKAIRAQLKTKYITKQTGIRMLKVNDSAKKSIMSDFKKSLNYLKKYN